MMQKEDKLDRNLKKLMPKGKALFLAYDQGLEHGPTDFNDENVNPKKIIEVAKKGRYNGIILQKGIAKKYRDEIRKSKVPLILKLNGKTGLFDGEPMSKELCTVKEAIKLGAKAVGYTIYIGSQYEPLMMEEFEDIEREAHGLGIPVIVWIYPRGKSVEGKPEGKLMAYSTRVALEIGADIVKIKYNGNKNDLKWAVKSAGKCKVMPAGGAKINENEFLKEVKDIISAGCAGIAVGRNVWQNSKPLEITKKIKRVLF